LFNYLCNQCLSPRGRHDHDRMVVVLTTCAISAYPHYGCEFESCSWPGVLNITLCDKSLSVTCHHDILYLKILLFKLTESKIIKAIV
jgi:hypothetical protein